MDDSELDDGTRKKKRGAAFDEDVGGDDGPELLRPSTENCPLTPLGKYNGMFAFMTPGGEIEYVRAKDLQSPAVLAGLFDGNTLWLRQCFRALDKPGGYVALQAATWLMRVCRSRDFFRPETDLRGPGAWRLKDSDELLLHLGDKLHVLREGRPVEVKDSGCRIGQHLYVASRAEPKPAATPASAEEVVGLFGLLDRWRYSHPEDPRVILGWIGCAYLAGALRWRPHIWITGGTGTGKSTLEGVLRDLLGSTAVRSADPTKMAIAQLLAGAARPVLLDEFERDLDPSKQETVVQLARLASTEDQAQIIRGSPEGRVRSYVIRGTFYFSGIVPAPLQPQDRSRIHVIDLGSIDESGHDEIVALKQSVGKMKALSPRLRARAYAGFWRFQQNEIAFEEAIMRRWSRGGRIVDQMGTLLAMSEMLLRDEPISVDAAMGVLQAFDSVKEELIGRSDESEGQLCISHLLSSMLEPERGQARTVAELICYVRDATMPQEDGPWEGPEHRELRRHGLALVVVQNEQRSPDERHEMALVVANKHRGLMKLFEGTHWTGGAWPRVLRRLPDSWATAEAVRFSGFRDRGTVIALKSLPLEGDAAERAKDPTDGVVARPAVRRANE